LRVWELLAIAGEGHAAAGQDQDAGEDSDDHDPDAFAHATPTRGSLVPAGVPSVRIVTLVMPILGVLIGAFCLRHHPAGLEMPLGRDQRFGPDRSPRAGSAGLSRRPQIMRHGTRPLAGICPRCEECEDRGIPTSIC
jgi:hypothetical protein